MRFEPNPTQQHIMTSKPLLLSTLLASLLLAPALAWSAPAPAAISPDAALFGSPAPVQTVGRTIAITPETRFVNVVSGESVAIRAGDRTVNWNFLQALNGATLPLRLLMPDAPQAAGVYVHVAPSEVYSGG